MKMGKNKTYIGLEVHVELSGTTKMFCACSPDHFGKKPNIQVCPVCLGLPGALPFANRAAVLATIKLGLALGCSVNHFSKFDRKHYFYPDLPKGYQISQYDLPLCVGGEYVDEDFKVKIRRIHLEEDTGKLVHQKIDNQMSTLIDFNRSGVALTELVTEPTFNSSDEVVLFLKEIQTIVRYLGISNADMEKGSMRLEANVSVGGENKLPDYKVELKNINSFRFVKNAIDCEVKRQTEMLERGKTPIQETRGYKESSQETFSQRTKEEAKDYRYFPEPDLPPLTFTEEEIENIRSEIPELPLAKRARFIKNYNLTKDYVRILANDPERSNYFEKAVKAGESENISPKTIADLMINKNWDKEYAEPQGLIRKIIQATKVKYLSAEETREAIRKVLEKESRAVADYKNGKGNIFGFLIGVVQKELGGKGDIKLIREHLEKSLNQ